MFLSFRLKLCRLILWDTIKEQRASGRDYGALLLAWYADKSKRRNAAFLIHRLKDSAPAIREEIDGKKIVIEWVRVGDSVEKAT